MKYSILIVDDDAEFRTFIRRMLSGYIVFEAADARETKKMMHRPVPIDIVLLDLKLPGTPGLDILKEIKSANSRVAIIIITAYGSKDNVIKALRDHADDFLEKPVKRHELLSRIERIISTIPVPPTENALVQQMLHYIDINYNKQITLNKAAAVIHHNPKYLSRLFKSITGISFSTYKQKVRVEHACRLLVESNDTIDEISYQVGYLNTESFSRTFKKFKQETPSAYRDTHTKASRTESSAGLSSTAARLSQVHWTDTLKTLRAHRSEFVRLAQQSPEIIALFDREMRHVFVNNAVRAYTGIPRRKYIGKTNEELGFPDHLCLLWNQWISSVFSSSLPVNAVFDFTGAHGEDTLAICMTPVFNEQDEAVYVLSIVSIITGQSPVAPGIGTVSPQQERAAAQPGVSIPGGNATKLKTLGTRLSAIVHELKTPLASADTIARTVLMESNDNSVKQHIANLQKKLFESQNIITNLLNFMGHEGGTAEPVNLIPVLSECCTRIRKRFRRKNIRITENFSGLGPLLCMTDPALIRMAVRNVLQNAFQAVPAVSGHIDISAAKAENDMVMITIMDNGKGIARNDLPRIVEPFYTTRSRGTGLGLYISNTIISRYGGSLTVSSTKGEGTSVCICLKQAG
jgi:signal transduction histidine kinase/AraC-like DNA-binding protein